MKNIVWIASYLKSGNTWFRILLENFLSKDLDPISINEINNSTIASSRELFDHYSFISSSDLSDEEIDNIRPEIFRMLSSDYKKDIYLKVHESWGRNSKGNSLFPEDVTKGVIYIIRNPLDVAISNKYHNNSTIEKTLARMNDPNYSIASYDEKLAPQLKQYLSSWSNHVSSWVDQSNLPVMVIKYEDLLENPLDEFSKALKFLNLKIEKKQIEKAVFNSNFEILQKQEERDGFKEKPIKVKRFFRKGIPGEWKSEIEPSITNKFISENINTMKRFGYY